MKTVGEFKKAGLVFVKGDGYRHRGSACELIANSITLKWFERGVDASPYAVITSFAWRENTGVKPEFNGEMELMARCGSTSLSSYFLEVDWEITEHRYDIIKWRPSLNQQKAEADMPHCDDLTETPEEAEAFAVIEKRQRDSEKQRSPYDVDAHVSGEKVKPVFTQAMADAGELPPVGSLVDVTDKNVVELFYGQGEVNCEVLAHIESTAVIRMSFGLGCFSSDALKASDTRTPKQKAVENAYNKMYSGKLSSCNVGVTMTILGDAFDAGLLKC